MAEFDLICVGSGVAGCAAALAGADAGLRVCLVEKADKLGGGSAYSLGSLWVGANHLAQAAGIADTYDETRTYLRFLAGGAAVDANLDAYVDNGPAVLREFERMGARFRIIKGLPDHYYPDAPGTKAAGRALEAEPLQRKELGPWADALQQGPYTPPGMTWTDAMAWGGFANRRGWDHAELERRKGAGLLGAGQALVAQLLAQLVKRGVEIRISFAARELMVSHGRVTGVGGDTALEAKRGVVLATGGYEGSEELIRRYDGLPEWRNMFPESVQGDALVMATEIGAATYHLPVNLCTMLGYFSAGAIFRNAGSREFTFPHSFIVNRAGERFADESQFQQMVPALRRFDPTTHTYANLPCFFIFDRQYLERYALAAEAPGTERPGWLTYGNTLEELAQKLGIADAGLRATADAFNRHASKGMDPEFGRGRSEWSKSWSGDQRHGVNPILGPVSEAPFCGVRLYPTGAGSAGLLTDSKARVLHVRGQPIPGLYACGNAAAPTAYGAGYQAGLTLMGGLIFGYLAARDASRL
jgi:3-oxosteroid 1-dehydrogenase